MSALDHPPRPPASAGEQVAIVDALYRFGAGQDLRDRALFESAFAEHATLDFTAPAWRLGAAIPVFEGRQTIADTIFAAIGGLDTSHTVTNPRVTAFKHATLFALVEAQHLPCHDHSRHLLLKHIYTTESRATERSGRSNACRSTWCGSAAIPPCCSPSRADQPGLISAC